MDKDYIWEAEYGRRNHLREILKELVRKQQAEALQMVALCVNNIPYNLELYIVVSYDRPQKEDIEEMQELFEGGGLLYRQDLTMIELLKEMGNRRFDSYTVLDEASVDVIFDGAFAFAEIGDLEKKGYIMKPLGKQSPVFISHSSKDKNEVEKLLPYLNGSGLPVWFDKYSIHIGESIVEGVQNGIESAESVIFWITRNFLLSKWCKYEMRSFVRKLIEDEILIISILDEDIAISDLPLFMQDVKALYRKEKNYEELAKEILPVMKQHVTSRINKREGMV